MKKVLFVISTLNGGGAERAISNISFKLKEKVEMHILVNSVSEKDYPCDAKIISLNMKPVNKKNIVYQIIALLKRLIVLRRLKKSGEYLCCVSFLESANFANVLTGKKYTRNYVSVRNNLSEYTDKLYKYVVNPVAKILYKKADGIIALSKGVERDLVTNFGMKEDKVFTIYNGYDINKIYGMSMQAIEAEHEKFFENNAPVFISIGRQTVQKGQWHLIRAFTEVVKKYPNSKLILLGQGNMRSYLEQLVCELGLSDNVVFLGFINNPYRYIRRSYAFVFSSLFEGFGNVVAEALACGAAIVSTDYKSGAREILDSRSDNLERTVKNSIEYVEYGVLVPVCSGIRDNSFKTPLELNEQLLGEAMLRLIDDKDMVEAYKNRAYDGAMRFSIDKCAEQWFDLFGC